MALISTLLGTIRYVLSGVDKAHAMALLAAAVAASAMSGIGRHFFYPTTKQRLSWRSTGVDSEGNRSRKFLESWRGRHQTPE